MTCLLVLLLISTKYYHIISNSMGVELWPAQDFCFREDNYITRKWEFSFACGMPTGPPLHPYQILSNSQTLWELWPAQDFGFRGDNYTMKTVRCCHSCTQHTYWSSSSFLPNIIKICLRVSKLWPAQDFCFRGDNYTTNKVRIVSLAPDTPIGPPLHPYQILSNYLKQYGSYGLHKISASRGITT